MYGGKDNEKNNNKKLFILIVFQISINKDKIKWLTIEEHEINLYFIKKYIENIYNIEIVEGYFYYILKSENNRIIDMETYNKFKNRCLLFDINNGFINNNFVLNDNTLITKNFFIFNEASLLKNNKNENANKKIKNLKMHKPEDLDDNVFLLLKDIVENKNKKIIKKEQFHIYSKELDMTDSSKSLTDFFIFLKKRKNDFLLYINGASIIIIKRIKNNYCIFSDYQVKIIKL